MEKHSMTLFTTRSLLILLLSVFSFSTLAKKDDGLPTNGGNTPMEVVKLTSDALTSRLKADQSIIQANANHTVELVREIILPKLATTYIARSVLGNHWKKAELPQKEKFRDQFIESLMRFYAKAFQNYTDETIRYNDEVIKNNVALVRTEIIRPQDTSIPVDYKLKRNSSGKWFVIDIEVKSVSLVKSNREQYDAEVGLNGLDAVIAKLEEKNKQKF